MDLFYYSRTPELAKKLEGKGVQEREFELGAVRSGGEYLGEITEVSSSNGARTIRLNNGTTIYEHAFNRFEVVEPQETAR